MEKGIVGTAVKFGIFALIGVLGFIALHNTMTNDVGGEQHRLHAEFENVSGLRQGDDVRISGVKVGRVEAVETVEVAGVVRARVTMRVQSEQQISDTTRVTMRYQNLLGQKYLALTPGRKAGTPLRDGATIGLDRTSPGFDLTALLNGFEPLFNVLSPEDINDLATNLIGVLQGESGSVELLLRQTADFTTFLADREQIFDEVVDNLTPVVQNLASNSDEFDTALTELRSLMRGLNEGSDAFFGALGDVRDDLDATTALVEELRPSVSASIDRIRQLGATIRRGTPVITNALDVLPAMVGAFVRSMSYGSHLQVYNCAMGITVVGENPVWLGRADDPHSEACR